MLIIARGVGDKDYAVVWTRQAMEGKNKTVIIEWQPEGRRPPLQRNDEWLVYNKT